MLNPSDHSPEQPNQSHPLKLLIQKHPFVFWGGLWITLLSVGGFAALGLITPGPTEQNTPKPTPAPAAVQVSAPREDLPLSLFTAIAIGCAAGSFLFVYVLKNSARSHQSSRRLNSTATITKKRRQVKKRAVAKIISQPVTSVALSPIRPQEKTSQVTVLSPEEASPLDRGDNSLADLLDLRKRQSLDSLMRRR